MNLAVLPVSSTVSPYIGVVPESTVDEAITPGMNFTVSVYTDYSGNDVWGYEFKLTYNPNVLEGIEVVNGDLITDESMFVPGAFNNTSGELDLTLNGFFFIWPPPPLTSGPGILANVTFSVIGYGNSDITLATEPSDPERTKLRGYYNNGTDWLIFDIIDSGITPEQIQHGSFANAPDLEVTSVTTSVVEAKPGTIIDIDINITNTGTPSESFNVTTYYDSTEMNTTELPALGTGENITLNVAWNTTGMAEGNYTMKAYAWPVTNETDTTDNTYINGEVKITSLIHDVAVTNITASPSIVPVGDTVNITVTAKNKGTEIETFNVTAYYDDDTIGTQTVTDLDPDMEEILSFLWDTTGITPGYYTVAITAESVSGETDTADNLGTAQVHLINHDVAVTSVTLSPTSANIGENVTITVIVENQGTETETFSVKVYYDSTEIGTANVTDLSTYAQKTLTFTWDTTGLDAGDYAIEATASTITGETDTTNNTKNYGTFTLSQLSSGWLSIELWVVIVAVVIAIAAASFYIISVKRRRTP